MLNSWTQTIFSVGLENKNAKPAAALRSFQQQQSRYCEIIGAERKERGDTQTNVQGRRDTIIHKFIFCVGEFLCQGEGSDFNDSEILALNKENWILREKAKL